MLKSVMADFINLFSRTKCSASTRGPKLQLLMWSILLNSFFFIPCVNSLCLGLNMTVDLYPTDVSIEHGQPLKLYCQSESVNDTRFTLSKEVLSSEIINSTTRLLHITKPERQDKVYFCENVKARKSCVSKVLVDTPPEPVNNFSCISRNLDVLNCSWINPKMYSSLNVSLSYYLYGNLLYPPCVIHSNENSPVKYCIWTLHDRPTYNQQVTRLDFSLTICNYVGCRHQTFRTPHCAIVKPDPPLNLTVLDKRPHSVRLSVKTPINLIDLLHCGLDHIIEYQIMKIDNSTYFHSYNLSGFSNETKVKPYYNITMKNLPYAHMMYRVRIYLKSRNAIDKSYWSDFKSIDFYTLGENPVRPPDTVAGSFVENSYKGRRFIYIYWKQIEEFEESGENFTYKVVVTQDNKSRLVPEKDISLSYAFCNVTESALHIRVWSMNSNGTSSNSSYLYIPPVQTSLYISSFTKLFNDNGTYELFWLPINKIDNYTLFWCIHNETGKCTGRMDFEVLSPEKSNHTIKDLPTQHRYQFAIAANNRTSTSGMVWTKCEISKDGFVMFKFPVKLSYDAPGKTFVNLKWKMECIVQEGIILGYNITYCPIVETTTTCEETQRSISIKKPDETEYKIVDLQPYRTYQFILALDTIFGSKTIDNATVYVTTLEDTPKGPISISISNVTNSSLVISWLPPKHKNTVIGRYVILNDTKELDVKYVNSTVSTDTSWMQLTLRNLLSFSNYSLAVKACSIKNVNDCSKIGPYDKKFVRTCIGRPSRMKAPIVDSNRDILKWVPPEIPGGTVDLYQVLQIIDDKPQPLKNSTELSILLTDCQGTVSTETYQVRAVNFDSDVHHGAIYDTNEFQPMETSGKEVVYEYPGEWSERSIVTCRNNPNYQYLWFLLIFPVLLVMYGGMKWSKRMKTKANIKPVFPEGLITEKDPAKYTFEHWNPVINNDKAPSDEMSLLPKRQSETSVTDKLNEGLSENTDRTIISDLTRNGVEQISVSAESSNSSLNSETEPVMNEDKNVDHEEDPSAEESDSSCENPVDLNSQPSRNNAASSYVSHINNPVSSNRIPALPTTNYQSAIPLPAIKSCRLPETTVNWDPSTGVGVTRPSPTPTSPAYVMAGIPRAAFFIKPHQNATLNSPIIDGTHYNEDKPHAALNISNVSQSPHKVLAPEYLPTLSSLPTSTRIPDSSYVQLETLDSLPSFKNSVHNTVPFKKPTTSNGYVSHSDVLDKHANKMITGSQFDDEEVILDPTMSANAYSRFSWSSNPTNDNLTSLLNESVESTKSN